MSTRRRVVIICPERVPFDKHVPLEPFCSRCNNPLSEHIGGVAITPPPLDSRATMLMADEQSGTKLCHECWMPKPIDQFYILRTKYYDCRCKDCKSIIQRYGRRTDEIGTGRKQWLQMRYAELREINEARTASNLPPLTALPKGIY